MPRIAGDEFAQLAVSALAQAAATHSMAEAAAKAVVAAEMEGLTGPCVSFAGHHSIGARSLHGFPNRALRPEER